MPRRWLRASSDGLDDRGGLIDLASVSIDTRATAPAGEEALSAPDGSGRYLLVQLDGPASAEQLAALERNVDRVYTYLPHDAYLVKAGRACAPAAWIVGRRPPAGVQDRAQLLRQAR